MFAECILIAHTKTQADNQMLQIKKRKNLSSLNEVQQSQQFRNSLQFNEKYVDNELLPQSRKNNENLKKVVSNKDIQIVLVSPQKAALQTCLDLFGDKEGIQIYVQPLLHPRINSAPFIPKNNQQILQKFKKEPYTNKITENKTWFLNYGSQDTHTATSESPQDHCLDMIRQIGDFQLQSMFAQRNNKFRKQLFDYITKSKKTIALITHPLMCQSLTATGWHEDGAPINSLKFDFGQIRREHIWIEGVIAEAEEKHTPFCGG